MSNQNNKTLRDDALIIAYLTGEASEAEAREFQDRIGSDPEFCQQVETLEAWLAPLDEDLDPVEPPAGLLDRLMVDIEGRDVASVITEIPVVANDRSALPFWRGLAIAASLLAIVSTAFHLVPDDPVEPTIIETVANEPETLLGLLSGESPSPLVAIVYHVDTGEVVATISNVDIPDDRDLQLWLIRDGFEAPLSLGVLDDIQDGQIALQSPEPLDATQDVLAVSLEVSGGSRGVGPQGPVLFSGPISRLP